MEALPFTQKGKEKRMFDAVKEQDLVTVLKLIKGSIVSKPIKPIMIDRAGCTLLHHAARTGNVEIFQTLLQYGADYNVLNQYGESCLHIATSVGAAKIIQLLLQMKMDPYVKWKSTGYTLLHEAASKGHIDTVELLLSKGCSVNKVTKDGKLALHLATECGREIIVKSLLKAKCDPDVRTRDIGLTPLHMSCYWGHVWISQYLVAAGADKCAQDMFGYYPISYAAKGGHPRAIEYLIGLGVSVECKDNYGNTPLHIAAEHGKVNCVEYLVHVGANINPSTALGETPLYYAMKHCQNDVVKLLSAYGGSMNEVVERHQVPVGSGWVDQNYTSAISAEQQRQRQEEEERKRAMLVVPQVVVVSEPVPLFERREVNPRRHVIGSVQ